MGLKERLLSFIEFKTLSVQRFEQEVGLSNASVSKMGDNTRRSTIDRISNKFPDININWLLTGEGEMLNPNSESLNGETAQSNAINSRIRQIIDEHFNGSIAEFCGKLNLRQATIITTLERNIPPSNEILMAIIEDSSLNISSEWLMTGKGEMIAIEIQYIPTTRIIDSKEELKEAIDKGIKLLPEVDFKFAAGQIELINGSESVKRYWFLPDCKDCEAVAQIAGSSMAPAYPSGCWVALKKHGFSAETATQIPFGNVFGIVIQDKFTGDYHGHIKVIRRYKDQELSRKYWIAHSLNDAEYDDFDIEIAQVRSLWIVKQHIVSDTLL